MLSEKSAILFFFGIITLENVLLKFLIGCCSSVGAVGNLDLVSLMVESILCMLCWSFATTFLDNSFTKVLGGVLAS